MNRSPVGFSFANFTVRRPRRPEKTTAPPISSSSSSPRDDRSVVCYCLNRARLGIFLDFVFFAIAAPHDGTVWPVCYACGQVVNKLRSEFRLEPSMNARLFVSKVAQYVPVFGLLRLEVVVVLVVVIWVRGFEIEKLYEKHISPTKCQSDTVSSSAVLAALALIRTPPPPGLKRSLAMSIAVTTITLCIWTPEKIRGRRNLRRAAQINGRDGIDWFGMTTTTKGSENVKLLLTSIFGDDV